MPTAATEAIEAIPLKDLSQPVTLLPLSFQNPPNPFLDISENTPFKVFRFLTTCVIIVAIPSVPIVPTL